MKISDINVFKVQAGWRNWVFVQVETDEGVTGIGESTLEGKAATVEGAILDLKMDLLGENPQDVERLWQKVFYHAAWHGSALYSAWSGIEMALWDIKGKVLGTPVYNLLGGRCRDTIRLYANLWYVGAETPAEYAEKARAIVGRGFTALKWEAFGAGYAGVEAATVRRTVERVRAVREVVGEDVDIMIDVGGRFVPEAAIKLGRALEQFAPFWYEEPVHWSGMDALAKVAEKVNVPIATGEKLFTKFGFKQLLERQIASVIQPDLCHAGGILEVKKIAAMAEANYVMVAPHNPNGPVSTAACLQLAACVPNFLILEYHVDDVAWRDEIVTPAERVEEGHLAIPTAPGLGIEFNAEAAAAHPYEPIRLGDIFPGLSPFCL